MEALGCEVEIYNDASKALKFIKNNEEHFDVILMDAEMPKMNGI